MTFERKDLSDNQLLGLYQALLVPRLIEEKMLLMLRQGKISKWFSGWGQEAISIGATLALEEDEYMLPMHRNLGVFTARNVPLERLFAQFQAKPLGFTKGRDRSFHFGSQDHYLVGMISHLGAQLPVACGVALGEKLAGRQKVTLAFTGDGGTSEGDFHEAMNVASVWQLPVIFVVENNGYSISTPTEEQFNFDSFVVKGPAYGMEAVSIDGNNLLEVYHTIRELAEDMRQNPRPILVEARTFRMRGHEEASGTWYVPEKELDAWAQKDPVDNFEQFLVVSGIAGFEALGEIREKVKEQIHHGLELASESPSAIPSNEEHDVYAPHSQEVKAPQSSTVSEKRFIDAVSDGLRESMERYPELVLMGEDIAEYGGVFKVTEGLLDAFGKERVRNTPTCESGIVGAGLGLAVKGYKSVIELQFADFVSCAFNQIVNNLAKAHYRWGQNADVVLRMPCGGGVGAGPFHSQSNEAWFFHTAGLKVVYPSTPYDAKGLLNASIEDPNPVLYFEHKGMYRTLKENIPDEYYTVEIGKARIAKEGDELSVITYGMGVHWAMAFAEEHPEISIEIIDLRTLLPWDKEAVQATVEKTGKVLVLHEDTMTGGIGAEISAWISEHCFQSLDAPVKRVASLDTPVPFAKALEEEFLAKKRLGDGIQELAEF